MRESGTSLINNLHKIPIQVTEKFTKLVSPSFSSSTNHHRHLLHNIKSNKAFKKYHESLTSHSIPKKMSCMKKMQETYWLTISIVLQIFHTKIKIAYKFSLKFHKIPSIIPHHLLKCSSKGEREKRSHGNDSKKKIKHTFFMYQSTSVCAYIHSDKTQWLYSYRSYEN